MAENGGNGGFVGFIAATDPLLAALKAGSSARFGFRGDPARLQLSLRGSSRSISALQSFCAGGAASASAGGAATAARDNGVDIDRVKWAETAGPDGREALAFVYRENTGGNALSLQILYYRQTGSGWSKAGVVKDVWGFDPRNPGSGTGVSRSPPRPSNPVSRAVVPREPQSMRSTAEPCAASV